MEGEDFETKKQRGAEVIKMLDGSGGEIQFRTRSTKGGLGEGYDLLIIDDDYVKVFPKNYFQIWTNAQILKREFVHLC